MPMKTYKIKTQDIVTVNVTSHLLSIRTILGHGDVQSTRVRSGREGKNVSVTVCEDEYEKVHALKQIKSNRVEC